MPAMDGFTRFCEAAIEEAQNDIAELRTLQLMERKGDGPWVDTTLRHIHDLERTTAVYADVLAAIRK